MKKSEEKRAKLEEKFKKVSETPASFAFFTAIHDFIEYIEHTPALAAQFSPKSKKGGDQKLAAKYARLKQIYQGFRDAKRDMGEDLGHARATTLRDLKRIENKETSDSNSFWEKREVFRKQAAEIYESLRANFPEKKETAGK